MSVPDTTHYASPRKPVQPEQVKFLVPRALKTGLNTLAAERAISLSALMRLIASEYVRRHTGT